MTPHSHNARLIDDGQHGPRFECECGYRRQMPRHPDYGLPEKLRAQNYWTLLCQYRWHCRQEMSMAEYCRVCNSLHFTNRKEYLQ